MDAGELEQAGKARIEAATTSAALEEARVAILGRGSELTMALRALGTLPPAERGPRGGELNRVRQALDALFASRNVVLQAAELDEQLRADAVDVTLPGDPVPRGVLHVLTQVQRELEDAFVAIGYEVAEGPEVESDYNNFTALNTPDDHPARDEGDTLWITPTVCLRTQTSPVQVRVMQARRPPVYVVAPGRVYRRDDLDATHSPAFQQIEGLAVDRGLSLADLRGTLEYLARSLFGADREIRLRSHFFPFTEPSVELDVTCFACDGPGSACRVCKGEGWIEVGGAGMVDPNVFGFVDFDPEEFTGFAFGCGIERIAMLRYGIDHVAKFYENDLRFLEQFAGAVR